jgi:hypothetical protein
VCRAGARGSQLEGSWFLRRREVGVVESSSLWRLWLRCSSSRTWGHERSCCARRAQADDIPFSVSERHWSTSSPAVPRTFSVWHRRSWWGCLPPRGMQLPSWVHSRHPGMRLWPCDCLWVSVRPAGPPSQSVSYSSSAWRSVKMALKATMACSCTSTTCNHHAQPSLGAVHCAMRYRGRVRTLGGLRGVAVCVLASKGDAAGFGRRESGVDMVVGSRKRRWTAVVEKQLACAESSCSGSTLQGTVCF